MSASGSSADTAANASSIRRIPLLSAPRLHFEIPESPGDAGCRARLARLLEELQSCAQGLLGRLELRVAQGFPARQLEERSSLHRLVRELRGLFVRAARLPERAEGSCALGGARRSSRAFALISSASSASGCAS